MPLWLPHQQHSFYHTKLKDYTREDKIWIFRSVQNSVVPISENTVNSYDSNSVIFVSISALGNEKQKLPLSLFTCSFLASPQHIWTYDMSLERHFQREPNAVGIVGNGSVGAKLFEEQV